MLYLKRMQHFLFPYTEYAHNLALFCVLVMYIGSRRVSGDITNVRQQMQQCLAVWRELKYRDFA
jgi:hypothetical protein